MSENGNTTKHELIKRVVKRLRTQLKKGEKTIFPALSFQTVNIGSCPDRFIVVCPLGGRFSSYAEQWPGHLGESWRVGITLCNRLKTVDESGRANQLLMASDKSLLVMEHQVLHALTGWGFYNDSSDSPVSIEEVLHFETCTPPTILVFQGGDTSVCCMTLDFTCSFYWDLNTTFSEDIQSWPNNPPPFPYAS